MANEEQPGQGEEFHPKGTVLFIIVFAIMLIVLWGSVYLLLLSQGPTTP
jgi:hypothetical protein